MQHFGVISHLEYRLGSIAHTGDDLHAVATEKLNHSVITDYPGTQSLRKYGTFM